MEKIAAIVDRLNLPPFSKGLATMAEFDSKSSLELLDILCEIVVAVDPDQASLISDTTEVRINFIIQFLLVMKFNIQEDQLDDFRNYMQSGDKEVFSTVMHWCLARFEHLQKRAYLAKFLMPVEIPPEFLGDQLVVELSERLKEAQNEFKAAHKQAEQVRSSGTRPIELKAEIAQLEQEKTQLQSKITRMKKDFKGDESYFQDMLKVTSALRKEQEEELRIFERIRSYRQGLDEAEARLTDANKRLSDIKSTGMQSQTAEQLLAKLQKDVRELTDKKEGLDATLADREMHIEKLQSWENSDKGASEEDVRAKRESVQELKDHIASLEERLDAALERNTKLSVFRQASTMTLKKLREREEEVDKLTEEKRRVRKQVEDKENELKSQGKSNPKAGRMDLKKYGAIVREKIDGYKRMREELSSLRAELVILQRTEQVLKSRDKNLEGFLSDLEKKKGVEGYRTTQRALVEMTEKAAEVDQLKGVTLEKISGMVEQIGKEFKAKQSQVQPLIQELKAARQEYMDVESEFLERKSTYDKVAVGLEMEKQALEKDCDTMQEECLREESRYHYLTSLISMAKIRLERAEQEKKWQNGDGRMMRDFCTVKDLYANKIAQQEQLTKQLRKHQKDLKENSGAMTNQKSNFMNLQALLTAKARGSSVGTGAAAMSARAQSGRDRMNSDREGASSSRGGGGPGGANVMSFGDDNGF